MSTMKLSEIRKASAAFALRERSGGDMSEEYLRPHHATAYKALPALLAFTDMVIGSLPEESQAELRKLGIEIDEVRIGIEVDE